MSVQNEEMSLRNKEISLQNEGSYSNATEEMIWTKCVLSLRCKPGKGKKPLYPISDALFAQESEHNQDLCKMSLDAPILGLKSNVVSYF